MSDVKARAELDTEQFWRDVERRHHRDALGAHHFARIADLVHLGVEIRDRLRERLALVVVAGDAVGPSEQVDFDGLRVLSHARAFSRASARAGLPGGISRRRFSRACAWDRW